MQSLTSERLSFLTAAVAGMSDFRNSSSSPYSTSYLLKTSRSLPPESFRTCACAISSPLGTLHCTHHKMRARNHSNHFGRGELCNLTRLSARAESTSTGANRITMQWPQIQLDRRCYGKEKSRSAVLAPSCARRVYVAGDQKLFCHYIGHLLVAVAHSMSHQATRARRDVFFCCVALCFTVGCIHPGASLRNTKYE
jgi:hypothetical protein